MTENVSSPAPGRHEPSVPVLVWPILVILVILVIALVGPCQEESQVVAPARDVEAFEMLKAGDLETKRVEDPPGDAYTKEADLIDAMAREDLKAGDSIEKGEVAPHAQTPGTVRLELQPEPAGSLELEPGKGVHLLLSPTRPTGTPLIVSAVLLAIPEAKAGEKQSYLVAMSPDARERLLSSLGSSRLLISAAD